MVRVPGISACLLSVAQPQGRLLEPCEQHDVVAPGQLSNGPLDNFVHAPSFGKGPHVHEVGAGKAFHLWESVMQVSREPLDDLGAPALAALAIQDAPTDLPIKTHQLSVDHQYGAPPRCSDPHLAGSMAGRRDFPRRCIQ